MCSLHGWVYPILIIESVIVGAFLYAVILYSNSHQVYSAEEDVGVPWEITAVLLASVAIVVGGLVAVSCLAHAHHNGRRSGLRVYLVWCVVLHLTVGPALAIWTLVAYVQRAREEGRASLNNLEYFFIFALIAQFCLGVAFFFIAWMLLKRGKHRAQVLVPFDRPVVAVTPKSGRSPDTTVSDDLSPRSDLTVETNAGQDEATLTSQRYPLHQRGYGPQATSHYQRNAHSPGRQSRLV